jgi:hypothetical protein
MPEKLRDVVEHPVSLDYFQQRVAQGWRLKAIEWEKDGLASTSEAREQVPYGLGLIPESARLEPNTAELGVMMTILELIVVEKGVSHIADELNARGYKTRQGSRWTSPAVFDLLPRLIEIGPELLKRDEWKARRASLKSA